MKMRWLPTMSACIFLAACGGGSGGGVGSTPTPTPTSPPTPTPTAHNATLSNLTVSELFDTNGATLSATLSSDTGTATTQTAGAKTITVSYDAANQSYTISSPTAATFRPADRIGFSQAGLTEYRRVNGSVSENLVLADPKPRVLRPDGSPAFTPGEAMYNRLDYVGAGIYQRLQNNGATIAASQDAFTYGVRTADSGVPRTGRGSFAVSLFGTSVGDTVYQIRGNGKLDANFGTGQISTSGLTTAIQFTTGTSSGGGPAWNGTAQIAAGTNNFNGVFTLGGIAGGWDGRFYGPGAVEVGAVFHNSADRFAATGFLVGSSDPNWILGINRDISNLKYDFYSTTEFQPVGWTQDAASGAPKSGSVYVSSSRTVTYTAATKGYSVDNFGFSSFEAGNINAAAGDSRYTVYEKDVGGEKRRLYVFRPDAANPDIQLTYATFGIWESVSLADGGATRSTMRNYMPFGIPTTDMPTTGTGSYAGRLYGAGASTGSAVHLYDLSGTATFNVNFSSRLLTGSLHPMGRDTATGATRDFGSFTMDGTGGTYGFVHSSIKSGVSEVGTMQAYLFGPGAAEIGGAFEIHTGDPTNPVGGGVGGRLVLGGIALAKRAP